MAIPTMKELTSEIGALIEQLRAGCSVETILHCSERYLLIRNLQSALAGDDIETLLVTVNTLLLKALQKTGGGRAEGGVSAPAAAAQAGAGTGTQVAGTQTPRAPAKDATANRAPPAPVAAPAPEPGPAMALPIATNPGQPLPVAPAPAMANALATSSRLPLPVALSSAAAPVDAQVVKRRGRPKKGADAETVQPQAAPQPVADAKWDETNIHQHPLFAEMVREWNVADLTAEFIKVIGREPTRNMTTGQMAASVLLGVSQVGVDIQSIGKTPPAKTAAVVEVAEDGEQQALPFDAAMAAEKSADLTRDLQADVDQLATESQAGAPGPSYPDDPMPEHYETHKVWFGDIGQIWECDKCHTEKLIMCIPALPLEGNLYCSTKCQKCGDAQRFPLTMEDAAEVRKIGKILVSRPPGKKPAAQAAPVVLPQARKKENARSRAAASRCAAKRRASRRPGAPVQNHGDKRSWTTDRFGSWRGCAAARGCRAGCQRASRAVQALAD